MDVLVILSGVPGNIVFSTPLIRSLKTRLDNPRISFLTSKECKPLLEENPYLDRVYDFDEFRKDRKQHSNTFTYVFDLDVNFRSSLIAATLSGKVFRIRKRTWEKWLLTRLKINKMIPTHVADQYLNAASFLNITGDGFRPDFYIPYKDQVPMEWLPERFQKGYVVFCISAQYATRRLPLSRMIEVCDRINKPVIILGDANDIQDGAALENFFARRDEHAELETTLLALNKKTVVYNGCGKFNFNQQASIVKQARYVFTFDNDFIAIASAFGKETFVMYGNTVLDFGSYPYQTRFTVFENNKLTCRPCSVKGYGKCPLKHFRCMNELVFDFYIP
jgi:ADP-heptose:LPS heptosyltransferase